MSDFNPLQTVKRRFFALRNGVIADTLRRAGSPFRIIFGLNLPQICEIANEMGVDKQMAEALWENKSTRESMLLAPMLFDASEFPEAKAIEMISQIPSAEIADVLCHKLLRHTPYAFNLGMGLAGASESMARYCSMRILWHFLGKDMDNIYGIAVAEMKKGDRLTSQPAKQIVEEVEFIREGF